MIVGVISDTHGLLRPQAVDQLKGADLIVHGGDIGSVDVIEALSHVAPVIAVKGNVDKGEWTNRFALTETVGIQGKWIYVLHNLKEMHLDPKAAGFSVVISGHSHKPVVKTENNVLYINPGSAGRRRFKLPVSVAKLHLTPTGIAAHIHELAV